MVRIRRCLAYDCHDLPDSLGFCSVHAAMLWPPLRKELAVTLDAYCFGRLVARSQRWLDALERHYPNVRHTGIVDLLAAERDRKLARRTRPRSRRPPPPSRGL